MAATEQASQNGRARLFQGCPPPPVLKGRGAEQPPKEQMSVLNLGHRDPEEAENGTSQNLKKPWLTATGDYQNAAVSTGRTEDRRPDGKHKV